MQTVNKYRPHQTETSKQFVIGSSFGEKVRADVCVRHDKKGNVSSSVSIRTSNRSHDESVSDTEEFRLAFDAMIAEARAWAEDQKAVMREQMNRTESFTFVEEEE